MGYEFALRGRAKEAERAIEAACLAWFGTLRPGGTSPLLRSDNGLIFQSRRFRQACWDYRLHQEFIRPIHRSRMASLNAFFGVSKKNVCGNTNLQNLKRLGRQLPDGWIGITRSARIKH